jgi:hypothetical protein
MLGLTFVVSDAEVRDGSGWCLVNLPLKGSPTTILGLLCDHETSCSLAAALFQRPVGAIESTLAEETMSELASLVADRISLVLAPDQHLGSHPPVTMVSGKLRLTLWISVDADSSGGTR